MDDRLLWSRRDFLDSDTLSTGTTDHNSGGNNISSTSSNNSNSSNNGRSSPPIAKAVFKGNIV